MRALWILPVSLLLLFVLAGCQPRSGADADATPGPRLPSDIPVDALPVSVAAHYFGRQWPKNFIAGFRREHVADDFRQLRADGFDTVVLLVAWGDFQPVTNPCCSYDERAFERLNFLLERAAEADLKVMLRLGYAWSFHPQSGDVGERQQQLMNDPATRAAYEAFIARVGKEVADHPHVVLGFMSWEDQWLQRVDAIASADYQQFLATLPADAARPTALPDPVKHAALFHAYWDWLALEKLYRPGLDHFPRLSYEARVDREPRFGPGPSGERAVVEWISHEGMTRLPPDQPLTIYWAPFWGALNQGEQLEASRSLALLEALLKETGRGGDRPLFIDQFNFVDNTPGHEHNAVLKPDEIAGFLHQSVCLMKSHGVRGYGIWTARDYAESSIHNPSFGYGLEGWELTTAAGLPHAALQALNSGDFQLRMTPGDQLSQRVTKGRGRVPTGADALADRVCVEADVASVGSLVVTAGGAPVALAFDATGIQRRCGPIEAAPTEEGLTFSLSLADGDLGLRDVQLFDHVQFGGLYDLDGRPGPLLGGVQRMNRDFLRDPAPTRCE